MALFFRLLKNDLHRAFWNFGTLAAVLLTFVIQMQAVFEELLAPGGDVIYYLELTLNTGYLQNILPAVGTLCYAWVFYQDRADGFSQVERIRVGMGKYLLSKACACWALAFCAVSMGMALFLAVLFLRVPLLSEIGLTNMDVYQSFLYGSLLSEGRYAAYISAVIFTRGCSAGAWALVGLSVSVFSRERYVLHIAPFFISYFSAMALQLAGVRITPPAIDTGSIFGVEVFQRVGPATSLTLGVFGAISAVSMVALFRAEERRLRHGGI